MNSRFDTGLKFLSMSYSSRALLMRGDESICVSFVNTGRRWPRGLVHISLYSLNIFTNSFSVTRLISVSVTDTRVLAYC